MTMLKSAVMSIAGNSFNGESLATWSPSRSLLGHFSSDAYASAYPNIRAITNEYMTIRPYGIDGEGERVKDNPIIRALYHPNQEDSSVAFAEKIAASTLVLNKTYILVWRREGVEAKPGGDFTTDTIAGFTFLEYPSVTRRDGRTYYSIGSQEFSDKQVIVLPGGVNPHDLYGGYSPSEASRRWATLDDYIADYQAGFFENGAVPAGQFMITAPTAKEYNDIVDMLQSRHRGAGKNGNVSYSHRPIDPQTNKPADAQVQWIPFSQNNKDIDFKNVFEQTNKRIDMSFGVSQFIKGVDDAPNYATAQVSDKNFAKRVVFPLALRNYTQITHELNRITNGTGIAITFDYTIPTVADEEKVVEETANIRDSRFIRLSQQGYTLKSIDTYFTTGKLSDLELATVQVVDDEDIDDGSEVVKSPDPKKVDGVTPLNKGAANGTNPKAELSDYDKLYAPTKAYMQRQIDAALEDLPEDLDTVENKAHMEVADPTTEDQDQFTEEMMLAIAAIMAASGTTQHTEGVALVEAAGLATETINEFTLSDDAKLVYEAYLRRVGSSYGADTAQSIRSTLEIANEQGLTRKQTEAALRNIVNTDEWRIARLARSELNRSESMGGLESMKQIQNESEVEFEKSLSHAGNSSTPCEFCQAMENNWVKVDQPLVGYGQTLEGTDGGIFINDFVDIDAGDVHANGKGTTVYRVTS